jgi:hypothetical protein
VEECADQGGIDIVATAEIVPLDRLPGYIGRKVCVGARVCVYVHVCVYVSDVKRELYVAIKQGGGRERGGKK